MNAALNRADLDSPSGGVKALRLELPELAWRRLRLSVRRARANGEAWDASLRFGAPLPALERLLDYWCNELDCRAVEARLNALPLFGRSTAGDELAFIHARSHDQAALPLLWLHGETGSIAEGARVVEALTTPRASSPAFHVVVPALPGRASFSAGAESALTSVARQLGDLMAALGYERYVVHGSGLGARLAAELCRLDATRVLALHVTSLAAVPRSAPLEGLSRDEKSRLFSLCERDGFTFSQTPVSPLEHLALATAQLADDDSETALNDIAPDLLWGLSYDLLRSDPAFRATLQQEASSPLPTRSEVPASVCSFPLGRTSLRRFAERAQRVVGWSEHEYGGELAAFEQPESLLRSLRSLCTSGARLV